MQSKVAVKDRPQIGLVADDNGTVRRDAKEQRAAVVNGQFELIAGKLAAVDDLTTRVGAIEKTMGEVRGLVLQLADGLSASRKNWMEGVASVQSIDSSIASMVQDLATDVAEMRNDLDALRGDVERGGAMENPSRLLEIGDDDDA